MLSKVKVYILLLMLKLFRICQNKTLDVVGIRSSNKVSHGTMTFGWFQLRVYSRLYHTMMEINGDFFVLIGLNR